ncbi:c-type cytochrome [Bradyrhizobium sp. 180]|uniref:c-type cytochrome n=1 Tax=unclassified Bradyrhizobium TaxID=2631580 RepID=UPI001FFB4A19|nr:MULTISPECIES: c-type cytochrome [unclassified Bradyrhizobium]MCK1422032.1 c-type cytochrome [Bradyrhizobium sp. CW12]MCK1492652.1 c-type cytochrome [Bradyrhizobium sp. 180]MCK1598139.1 c-type cytochrome [Bradyrhizobium sp. 164]MCK1648624.1 c-type cytochrome [Bradyrhizobium sp. 154]MCK1666749.1 c-type cytochrome [Bradyrhizobium sp. 153]
MEAQMQARRQRSSRAWLRAIGTGALTLFLSLPLSLAQQPASDDAAQQAFNNSCRTCHSMKEGDNRLGPNLNKIVGRKAGALPNYNYSSSMKEAGFIWDQDKLTRFMVKPDEVVSGHKMQPYGGISAEEAAKVVAYLQAASQ